MNQMFTLRAQLRTPVILRGYLTLDALLMAERQRGDVSDMLRCEDGLYYASAAFAVDVFGTQEVSFVASMRPTTMSHVWASAIAPNRAGKVSIGDARQREAGTITNLYTATACKAVEWYATGDPDAVLETVRRIDFIGKRRSAGMGQVAGWSVEAGELDGIAGYLGEPLRPVPVERWPHGGDWPVIEAAWRGEYWATKNRTACVAPEVLP